MLEPSGGYLNGYELYEDPDRPLLVRRATIELGEMSDHLVWRNIFFCGVKDEFPDCDNSRFVLPLIRPPIPLEFRGSRVETQKFCSKFRLAADPSYHLMAPWLCATYPNGVTGTTTKYQLFICFVQQ